MLWETEAVNNGNSSSASLKIHVDTSKLKEFGEKTLKQMDLSELFKHIISGG